MAARIRAHGFRIPTSNSTDRMRRTGSQGSTDPIYNSAEWAKLRTWIYRQRPRECEAVGCTTIDRGRNGRLHLDHKQELVDGGPAFDPANIEIRCSKCHAAKTALAKAARAAKRW